MALPPDLLGYRELVLDGRNADDLYADALELATTRLPGWAPRAGNTETVLLEALALIGSEIIYAQNEVPGVVVEGLARLLGVDRSGGLPASALVRFTVADGAGHTVPAGLSLAVPVGDGQAVLRTVEDLVIPAGATTGDVVARAVEVGSAANGPTAGTLLGVLDGVPYLERAVLASTLTGGADVEEDAAYAARAVARASRITTTLVLPEHFTSAALERPGVTRALTVNLFDPRQGGAPGDHLGHVTVAAAGPGGVALPASDAEDLALDLDRAAVAGLTVHVVAPTVTPIDVVVRVQRFPGYADAEVVEAVRGVLATYLSADAWGWQTVVPRNELIPRIDGARGVDLVLDLEPADDVVLPGVAPLAQLRTLDVQVVAP